MGNVDEKDFVQYSKWGDGIAVQEYNGKWQLVAAKKNQEKGDIWLQWCKVQKFQEEYSPNVPMKLIECDSKDELIDKVEALHAKLAGEESKPTMTKDDIAF